jgi:hypothetical protein
MIKKIRSKLFSFLYLLILRHSWAQFLHASAHCLHSSIEENFSHSPAHASHTSAHTLQICFAYSLPLDIKHAAVLHISAQSRAIIMHLVIVPTFWSLRHAVQHDSQASQHTQHASMQVWYFGFCRVTLIFIEGIVNILIYKSMQKILNIWHICI